MKDLQGVEKKVLGAMLLLADKDMNVKATSLQLAKAMGYKKPGGAITFAIQALEMKNFLAINGKGNFKILL